jgi:hypothetical protein
MAPACLAGCVYLIVEGAWAYALIPGALAAVMFEMLREDSESYVGRILGKRRGSA